MQATYGIDLGDALWGEQPMSPRRLLNLVKHLPDRANVRDPKKHRWGWPEELAAITAELVHFQASLFYSANTKKGTRPLKDFSVPRPYDGDSQLKAPTRPAGSGGGTGTQPQRRKATVSEVRAVMARWAAGRGG